MKIYNITLWTAYCQKLDCKWVIDNVEYNPGKDAGNHARKTGHDVLVSRTDSWIYRKEAK